MSTVVTECIVVDDVWGRLTGVAGTGGWTHPNNGADGQEYPHERITWQRPRITQVPECVSGLSIVSWFNNNTAFVSVPYIWQVWLFKRALHYSIKHLEMSKLVIIIITIQMHD